MLKQNPVLDLEEMIGWIRLKKEIKKKGVAMR